MKAARETAWPVASFAVKPISRTDPPPDLVHSPLYLLAVLCSARRSRDKALERLTRRRLAALGVDVRFADELAARKPAKAKGAGRE